MLHRKKAASASPPPPLFSSRSFNPRSNSPAAGWDADDEGQGGNMSGDDVASLPPTSVLSLTRHQHSPACAANKRPSLRDILSNKSSPPWTLTAFMAYLSTNHCLETLEFTMDATRYRKHYAKVMAKTGELGLSRTSKEGANMVILWTRLIEAYIRPDGSREINIPSEVRDPILHIDTSEAAPPPESLDTAVQKVYELMEESVLVPFLNSMSPVNTGSPTAPCDCSEEQEPLSPLDESLKTRKSRFGKHSPPAVSPLDSPTLSLPSPGLGRRKEGSSLLTTAMHKNRLSTKLSPTATGLPPVTSGSGPEATSAPGLTDESGYGSSYTSESIMTPPMSPPGSDQALSPRHSRDGSTWKKLGRLSQWKPGKKKSSQSFRDSESLP